MGEIFQDTIKMKHGRFVVAKDKRTGQIVSDIAELRALYEKGEVIEEMVSSSDSKEFFTTAINDFFMQEDEEVDVQWRQLYREVPMTEGSGMIFPFRDRNLAGEGSHGIVFREVGELGEVKFGTVTSDEKFIPVVKYMAALGYSNEWFEDSMFGLIEMLTEDFRRAAGDRLAEIHYGVLLTAKSTGVSKTTPVGGSTLDDFIAAINATVAVMRRNRFRPAFIIGAPEQEDIILQTMHDIYRDRTLTETSKKLTPIITDHFPAGTVCLANPRERLVSLDRAGLTLGTFDDLIHDAQTLVGKFRRGAALGDGKALRFIDGL